MTGSTLVLGLGNILLHDDAIGVWIAESLGREFEFPENVAVIEGGTLGLDLLPRLDGVERLLVADAVEMGAEPGEMVRFEGDAVPHALQIKLSPHQVGLMDLLAAARLTGCEPGVVVLWGMQPGRLDPGTGFSEKVTAALPALAAKVLGELAAWGISPRPLALKPPPPVWWSSPHNG
jgi:hydrogenase maturation protease